jgi:DNA-binding transcriptional LysR family regulator
MAAALPNSMLDDASILSLRCFAAVVETQSFSSAARQLRLAPSSVTKHVRLIEKAVNVALLHRTTRRVSVTEAGERFYDQCLAILAQIDSAVLEVVAEKELSGHLRVTAPPSFAAAILGPHIQDFLREYARISLDLVVSSDTPNLIRNRIDVAIRLHEEPQSKSEHFRLASFALVLCASPEYIAQRGIPQTANDLPQHDCLSGRFSDLAEGWTLGRHGAWRTVNVRFRLLSDNGELLRQACLGGAGIGNFYEFHVRQDLADGRLVRVLPNYQTKNQNLFAIIPHRQIVRPQAKVFIDFVRRLVDGVNPA